MKATAPMYVMALRMGGPCTDGGGDRPACCGRVTFVDRQGFPCVEVSNSSVGLAFGYNGGLAFDVEIARHRLMGIEPNSHGFAELVPIPRHQRLGGLSVIKVGN